MPINLTTTITIDVELECHCKSTGISYSLQPTIQGKATYGLLGRPGARLPGKLVLPANFDSVKAGGSGW